MVSARLLSEMLPVLVINCLSVLLRHYTHGSKRLKLSFKMPAIKCTGKLPTPCFRTLVPYAFTTGSSRSYHSDLPRPYFRFCVIADSLQSRVVELEAANQVRARFVPSTLHLKHLFIRFNYLGAGVIIFLNTFPFLCLSNSRQRGISFFPRLLSAKKS